MAGAARNRGQAGSLPVKVRWCRTVRHSGWPLGSAYAGPALRCAFSAGSQPALVGAPCSEPV